MSEITGALEAILFAAGEPLSYTDIKKVFERMWAGEDLDDAELRKRFAEMDTAIAELKERWPDNAESGFFLAEVAEGFAFRTNPRHAAALKAMREQRPVRLSRAALETLSIVAYRQPVTKPEVDHIRGVDCSSTMRLLLDRGLIRITGKKEEPGLPLLYGTTREFLSFFNLATLAQLPTLREFHELSEESQDELDAFASEMGLDELRKEAKEVSSEEEPAVVELDQAVATLKSTEKEARKTLAEHGVALEEPKEPPPPVAADGAAPGTPASEEPTADPVPVAGEQADTDSQPPGEPAAEGTVATEAAVEVSQPNTSESEPTA